MDKQTVDVMDVRRGDIVEFSKYRLRVDREPVRSKSTIDLTGRISIDGCPSVTKRFIKGMFVQIERQEEDDCQVNGID